MFGPNGSHAQILIRLLLEQILNRSPDDRIDTLYIEWRRLVDIVYGSLNEQSNDVVEELKRLYNVGVKCQLGELLFAVQTYLAIVSKFFAAEIMAQADNDRPARPTLWTSFNDDDFVNKLQMLDSGQSFSRLTIENLFERDVFSWYIGILHGNTTILSSIRTIISDLDSLALPQVVYGVGPTVDVLRDLYHELLPRLLRRALGEFLTPLWLAEKCIERLAKVGADFVHGRVLDPTCGTGTFLVPVLRARVARLRATGNTGHSDIVALLKSLCGFDINPIAVTAARANMVMALGDLAAVGPLTLPIWKTDSINVPEDPAVQTTTDAGLLLGRVYKELKTSLPIGFPIPVELTRADYLAILRQALEVSVNTEDDEAGEAEFNLQIRVAFGPESKQFSSSSWENIEAVSRELYFRIRELEKTDRDGVWARIIENSFAPLLAGNLMLC